MADTKTSGASAPRKTKETPFFSCSSDQEPLFSVREGLDFEDALNQASCFMMAAHAAFQSVAEEVDSGQIWGAVYLSDMAIAVLDSAISALIKEKRNEVPS